MDPTWLDQLLAFIKGPGIANTAGLNGVAGALNKPDLSGLPNISRAPKITPPQGPIGPMQGGYGQPPLGVPQGSPYSGQTGVVPSGPATNPVQLPVPAQTRAMTAPNMPPPPAPPGLGQIGQAGGMGQLGPPGTGNPVLGPGSAPFNQMTQAGQSAASALGKSGLLGLLLQTMKPQPAGGGPQPPQTGIPVTPTGPLPPASQTFNGNPFGQGGPPMPRPNPLLGGQPSAPFGPPLPPQGGPGLGGKGGPGAGVMPGVPYAAPGQGGKGDPLASASPDLIQRMIRGLMGSPLAGGWNQQGTNTASGF